MSVFRPFTGVLSPPKRRRCAPPSSSSASSSSVGASSLRVPTTIISHIISYLPVASLLGGDSPLGISRQWRTGGWHAPVVVVTGSVALVIHALGRFPATVAIDLSVPPRYLAALPLAQWHNLRSIAVAYPTDSFVCELPSVLAANPHLHTIYCSGPRLPSIARVLEPAMATRRGARINGSVCGDCAVCHDTAVFVHVCQARDCSLPIASCTRCSTTSQSLMDSEPRQPEALPSSPASLPLAVCNECGYWFHDRFIRPRPLDVPPSLPSAAGGDGDGDAAHCSSSPPAPSSSSLVCSGVQPCTLCAGGGVVARRCAECMHECAGPCRQLVCSGHARGCEDACGAWLCDECIIPPGDDDDHYRCPACISDHLAKLTEDDGSDLDDELAGIDDEGDDDDEAEDDDTLDIDEDDDDADADAELDRDDCGELDDCDGEVAFEHSGDGDDDLPTENDEFDQL